MPERVSAERVLAAFNAFCSRLGMASSPNFTMSEPATASSDVLQILPEVSISGAESPRFGISCMGSVEQAASSREAKIRSFVLLCIYHADF